MVNSANKGSRWESAVAAHLADRGASVTHRRSLYSPGDDMTALVGGRVLSVECKNAARLDLAGWIDQARSQPRAPGSIPVVVVKRRGRSDPGDAYAVLRLGDLIGLLSPEPGGQSPEPF